MYVFGAFVEKLDGCICMSLFLDFLAVFFLLAVFVTTALYTVN
jgi:hypothetical protein